MKLELVVSTEQPGEQTRSSPPSRLMMKRKSPKCMSAPGTQSSAMMAVRHLVEKKNERNVKKAPIWHANCRYFLAPASDSSRMRD